MIDLEKFCDKEGLRESVRNPWRVNGFVYATDGTILVRVDSNTEVSGEIIDGTNKQPDCEKLLTGASDIKDWNAIPDFPVCDFCNDSGKRKFICHECNGEGIHKCRCGDTHTCGECDGDGEISKSCKQCGIMLGPRKIANRLAWLIKSLPNSQYGIDSDDKHKPIHFKFDGGIGIAMPIYQE